MNPTYPTHLDEVDGSFLDRLLRRDSALRNYGRVQHGMNGKDADLSCVGQCVVTQLTAHDEYLNGDTDKMRVTIDLRCYATICAPTGENFNHEAVIANANPEDIAYFVSENADPRTIDADWESGNDDEAYRKIDFLVEYYQQQAQWIMEDIHFCDDPFAIMWNDDAWEGGVNVQLEAFITCDEWEQLESGEDVCPTVLDEVEKRIADAIYAGNETHPAMKQWEESVAEANKRIDKLDCYHQPTADVIDWLNE